MKPSDLPSHGPPPTGDGTNQAPSAGTRSLEETADPRGLHSDCRRRVDPLKVLGSAHELTAYGEKFRGSVPWRRT
jgi:hypothetical protein